MPDTSDPAVLKFQQFSNDFDLLCQKRHEEGAAEYGQFTFLENDVVRMMAEELADTANYCRMQFIKLLFLQEMLVAKLDEEGITGESDEISIGIESFKGTKDVGWNGR